MQDTTEHEITKEAALAWSDELGRIAFEEAAKVAGCDMHWENSNKEKWIAAATAVSEACAQLCEKLPYGSGLAGKTYAEALRGVGFGANLAKGIYP